MSNVYTIGVRMTMDAHGVSAVLRTLAHEFIGIHHHIGNATAAMGRFQTAVIGAGAALAGIGIAKGLASAVEHGAELVKVQSQMRMAGWEQVDIAQATARAYELSSKYQSLSATHILESEKEIGFVMGDRHHAIELAQKMAVMEMNLQGSLGVEQASAYKADVMAAVRAAEMSGNAMDQKRFGFYLDSLSHMINATGGTVRPSEVMMATQYGRAAAMSWSDDFTSYVLPTLIQQQGGAKTGTAIMSMWQAVVGGHMQKGAIPTWEKLGLLDPALADEKNLTPERHFKHWDPGAMKNLELFKSDPFKFAQDVIVPAMLAKGVISQAGWEQVASGNIKEGLGAKTRSAIVDELTQMFSNRTAQGIADVLVLEGKKVHRDADMLKHSMGGQGGAVEATSQYEVTKKAFFAQWDNVMSAFGSPAVAVAIEAMKGINDALSGMATFAFAHPEGMALTFKALAGIAAGLATLGSAAVIGALVSLVPLAGVAGSIIAVSAALATLVALNWSSITAGLKSMRDYLLGTNEYVDKNGGFHAKKKGLVEYLPGYDIAAKVAPYMKVIGQALIDGIASIPAMVMGAIQKMAASIGSAISAAISGLGFGGGLPTPGGGARFHQPGIATPQSYVPPASSGAKPIQIRSEINMDGRKVAEQVSHHIARGSRQVYSSAGFDPIRSPTPVDYQYI